MIAPFLILFGFLGGSAAQHEQARSAMSRWERQAFIRFVEVEKPLVTICFDHALCPCEWPFNGALGHARPYTQGALVHVNPDADWTRYDLTDVLMHEIGHVLQFDRWSHNPDWDSCMNWVQHSPCEITFADQMEVCAVWGCEPFPRLVVR